MRQLIIGLIGFLVLPLAFSEGKKVETISSEQAAKSTDVNNSSGKNAIKKDEKFKKKEKTNMVEIKTNLGTIVAELDAVKAPNTVKNFLRYVGEKQYDGTIFHRVIPNFMIQGGGMDKDMKSRESHEPIQNEADNGLKNEKGTLAMARTGDPHSATNQFFINVNDNTFLNFRSKNPPSEWGYAVFGKVTKGMDVVDKIKAVSTGNKGQYQDVPTTPVIIESIRAL